MIKRKDYTDDLAWALPFDDRCRMIEELSRRQSVDLDKDASCGNASTKDEYGEIISMRAARLFMKRS